MKYKKYVDGIRPRQTTNNKQIALQLTQKLFFIAIAILAIDAMFFMLWVASGQHPVDEFYFGSITAHILKAILF